MLGPIVTSLRPGVFYPKDCLGVYLRRPNEPIIDQPILRPNTMQKLKSFNVTRKIRGRQVKSKMDICRVFKPDAKTIERLKELWNESWGLGLSEDSLEIESLRKDLFVENENVIEMHEHSWSNILVAVIDGKIVGAIWGVQRDFEIGPYGEHEKVDWIRKYDLLTDEKTFENSLPEGNTRFCVSVVVDRDYLGSRIDGQKMSIGQALVTTSFIDAVCHPFQVNVIAHSRMKSLKSFVELIWGLRLQGYNVRTDEDKKGWLAEHDGRVMNAKVTRKGIWIDGRLYTSRDEASIIGNVSFEQGRYVLHPGGLPIYTDDVGVFMGERDYLVEFGAYLDTDYELMKRVHGWRGGEVIGVIPHSRTDIEGLDANLPFLFRIGTILLKRGLFAEIFSRFNESQKRVVTEAIVSPHLLEKVLKKSTVNPKDLFRGAFSRKKTEMLIAYVKHANNQKALIQKLRERAPSF